MKVGCEREDGLLNIHDEQETCEVCLQSIAVDIGTGDSWNDGERNE